MDVSAEIHSRNVSFRSNFDFYYQWVDISARGLLALDDIILPVVNTSALIFFIYMYIYIYMLEISSS